MFFKKKSQEKKSTPEANEYKRGYQDGYYHGLEQTDSNIMAFNNNVHYIKGYQYGYQVGSKERRFKQSVTEKSTPSSNNSDIPPNSMDRINAQKNAQQLSSENKNMFQNFYQNKL